MVARFDSSPFCEGLPLATPILLNYVKCFRYNKNSSRCNENVPSQVGLRGERVSPRKSRSLAPDFKKKSRSQSRSQNLKSSQARLAKTMRVSH
jgi:hypothetical protein